MRKYMTEFIGTFFLVLTIGLTVLGGAPIPALAIGSALMIMVYMGGHISGAHYNPAVSFALLMRRKLPGKEYIPYVIAQIAGSLFAALIVRTLMGQTIAPAPGATVSLTGAMMVEVLFTFALALVVLNTAASAGTKGNSFYGLAIGFTVFVAAAAGGPISGGAFNPAVGIGLIVVDVIYGGGTFGDLWIYILGPLAGGALAAMVFSLQEREA